MKQINFESGRSMTEMLGTLAIIGVLSIGGIAGYSYGMDKYRANQTINDIMLMGVDMITQTSQKRGVPTLTDWGTKTTAGYDFTVVPKPKNETQYGIQITGIPSSICKMVGDGLKQTVAVYVGNEDYDSDTKEDPCDESDNNTMEFYFDTGAVESDGCKTDSDCGDGRYCDMGLCFNGSKPEVTANIMGGTCETDADCNTGWTGSNCAYCDATYGCVEKRDNHNKTCTLTDANVAGKCGGGKCNPSGCNESNPCKGDKEYCASPNNSCEEAFRSGEEGMCIVANTTFSRVNLAGKNHYISNGFISWWDADAGCKALGRDGLIGVSDLVTGWAGKGDYNSHELTALGKALQSHLGTDYEVWTSDDDDSCSPFRVYLDDGNVRNNSRNDYSYDFAVCR
ncbi:MAG: hypothetical protein IJV75_06720 [Alphaproteobacteria bacterium]|nr:hypothetical protein [Alphaproteobacteria bacterium]